MPLETGAIALIISVAALLIVLATIVVNLQNKNKSENTSPELSVSDSADIEENAEKQEVELSAALSEADSIEIVSDQFDGAQSEMNLIFERVTDSDEKQYKEIALDKASQVGGFGLKAGSAIGQQLYSIHQLAAQAPNGLFTATTNPALLSKLSDGTVSTMVHGSKGIVAHYGFEELKESVCLIPA